MIGVGILLTICAGIFVASEFSMLNLERNELEARAERGEKGLSNSIRALSQTRAHLAGAQLGITVTNMLTGFIAEPAVSALLAPGLTSLGIAEAEVEPIALVITMIVATLFSTLFGELIPKKLALTDPLAVNKFVAPIQLGFTWFFKWMIVLINKLGGAAVRLVGIEPREELESTRTAEELTSLVRRAAAEGGLEQRTATLITKTLRLNQLAAADVMTSRTKMHSIEKTATAEDVIRLTNETGHSRFPVTDGSTDYVVGIVHVKRAVEIERSKRSQVSVENLMASVERVPETMRLENLLGSLRKRGHQVAIVVDEYGGTAGLVTLEDLVEELVGELQDEHDRTKTGIRRGSGQTILLPGLLRPDELAELAIKIPDSGAYETVGGFVMNRLGNIPAVGDTVKIDGGSLRVERMDGRRIDRLRFIPDQLVGELDE